MISNLKNYYFRYATLISSKTVIVSNLSNIFLLIEVFEGLHFRTLLVAGIIYVRSGVGHKKIFDF